jgi:DNA-binding transcriptional ArsR family regulator
MSDTGTVDAGTIDAGTVLAALADPTRREVLAAVAARAGTATATELALELPITRQAITKHLTILAEAGLVASVRHGREARYRVVAGSLRPAADWIAHTEASWGRRVDRLQRHLADR